MHNPFRASILASLIGFALSHGAGEETTSVSTADFKSSFRTSSIVPDVLAAFGPSVSFYVGYTSADGDGAMMMPGSVLTTAEAKAPFEMSVEGMANATNVTADTRFIVYMIGPDVPSRSNPTSRNVRHFLAGNLTVSSKNSSVLATATTLTNSSAATNEYFAPAPSPNTGSHRYVYLLYTQPEALNTKGFADLGFNVSNRMNFNLTAFRTLAGLGPSIGGTFFEIDTSDSTNSSSKVSGAAKIGGDRGGVFELVVGFGVAVLGALFVGLV